MKQTHGGIDGEPDRRHDPQMRRFARLRSLDRNVTSLAS